jgi:hypothetical protein
LLLLFAQKLLPPPAKLFDLPRSRKRKIPRRRRDEEIK